MAPSASVGDAYPDPRITHLLIVHDGVVERNVYPELRQVQFADRAQHSVRRHDAVMLGGNQRGARIDEGLLLEKDV
jgi:hypothetical protein